MIAALNRGKTGKNEICSQITHLTACKSAGRRDRDGISLILKRNSTEVRLGQTDQLLMVDTCGGKKITPRICEGENLPENQCASWKDVQQKTTHLQQQPVPCEELCSDCWCSPQDSGGSESWEDKLLQYQRTFMDLNCIQMCHNAVYLAWHFGMVLAHSELKVYPGKLWYAADPDRLPAGYPQLPPTRAATHPSAARSQPRSVSNFAPRLPTAPRLEK